MKAGTFNANNYLERLHEEADADNAVSSKGYIDAGGAKAGIMLPPDTKKNFDWLNKEYQKGKTEVKIEVKGEGSSFKPGYDLQTDLKSVKDFQPGMYGEVKTTQGSMEDPKSPQNKKGDPPAEKKTPQGDNEAKDDVPEKKGDKQKGQALNIDLKTKKDGAEPKEKEDTDTKDEKEDDKK